MKTMFQTLFLPVAILTAILSASEPGALNDLRAAEDSRATSGSPASGGQGLEPGREDRANFSAGLRSEQELPDRYIHVVQDILKYCQPQRGFWVDLGAGKGQVAIPLIEATDNPVVMLDPNVDAMRKGLAIARAKGLEQRLSAVVGVAEKMPFPDGSVDLLVSRGSIFFWDDPVQGLREVVRVLRPGGKAYIGGGAGSSYPKWAAAKLIEKRKANLAGKDAARWQRFVELRRPEQMRAWCEAAQLGNYTVMGKGAISAEDPRVGQGIWVLLEKADK